MTFEQLQLIEPIQKALAEEGYTTPTPIQAQAIPFLLDRNDLLGCAQTGTGKTAAFAIPILQLLTKDAEGALKVRKSIKCLVLTPTRELAIQIHESFLAYGKYTNLKSAVIFGGVSQKPQTDTLRQGVDILIATPGRLIDLMHQNFVNIQYVKMFVLDEADRMLDMGFVHDVKRVVAQLPEKRQSLFFSATMPPEIQKLANTILVNPKKVEVTPVSTTAETIDQCIYFVEKNSKKHLLAHLLQDKAIASVLVFTRTKHGANKVVKDLESVGINAEAIHGNKSQNARQNALSNFKSGKIRVLIATDIAARGIDIEQLSHVINYELPNISETYVHRIGRTGRAGASGISISFCDEEEVAYLRDIQKLIGKIIPVVEKHPHAIKREDLPDFATAKPPVKQQRAPRPPRENRAAPQKTQPAPPKPQPSQPKNDQKNEPKNTATTSEYKKPKPRKWHGGKP